MSFVRFWTIAAEDTRVAETTVDEPAPTAGSSTSNDLYLQVDPNNRTHDHTYQQLNHNVKKPKIKIKPQNSHIYVNFPRPKFPRDNHGTAENDKHNQLYSNVKQL